MNGLSPHQDHPVRVRELAAWDFDDYPYRPIVGGSEIRAARRASKRRPHFDDLNPVMADLTSEHDPALAPHALRSDLIAEVDGLRWSVEIIDLRRLVAFQRRLSWNRHVAQPALPAANDWDALIHFAFPPARCASYKIRQETSTFIFDTSDPNLHLRLSADRNAPFSAHTGSPFIEVAHYRGRWFLRDGYHRAYALMQANIFFIPAVVVETSTLADLGADQPQFFPEATLLGETPPCLVDFLDPVLTFEYSRPVLTRSIHVTISEISAPAHSPAASSND